MQNNVFSKASLLYLFRNSCKGIPYFSLQCVLSHSPSFILPLTLISLTDYVLIERQIITYDKKHWRTTYADSWEGVVQEEFSLDGSKDFQMISRKSLGIWMQNPLFQETIIIYPDFALCSLRDFWIKIYWCIWYMGVACSLCFSFWNVYFFVFISACNVPWKVISQRLKIYYIWW